MSTNETNLPRIKSQNSLTLKGWAFTLRRYEDSGVELSGAAIQQLRRQMLEELGLTEGDMTNLAARLDEKAPRDLSRHEYLDLAARGQVTDEERLIYLEHCYVVDDLSRDSRMRLSADIQEIRDKIGQDRSR